MNRIITIIKGALLVFAALYITAGTIAMGIVHHQHKGNMMGWLAGTQQPAIQQVVAQKDECEQAYGVTCEQYTYAIAMASKEERHSNNKGRKY